jgi:hypothetical protein
MGEQGAGGTARRGCRKMSKRKLYITRGWLKGRVDSRCFPGVHSSYTREEALDLPTQTFCPDEDVDY